MVINQLYEIKALLDENPPNVDLARLLILNAIAELRLEYRKTNHTFEVLRDEPVRPNDALLKEFGW